VTLTLTQGNSTTRTVDISNVSTVPITFSASDDKSWLSLSAASGSSVAGSPQSITVTINATGLAPGVHTGTLAFNSTSEHLTMVQEVPVTGVVIVGTPQEVALADVIKGISMFTGDKINVPVLGIVENMSWFTPEELPENRYYIFGKEGCKRLAEERGIALLGQIPIVQGIRESGDAGEPVALYPEKASGKAFHDLAEAVRRAVEKRNKEMEPTRKVEINK